MRRLLIVLAVAAATGVVLASASVRGATASPPDSQHAVYSHDWEGITFVGGLGSCPLFGATSNPFYVFGDVDLTDQIVSTETPIPPENFLYQLDSVGSVHGVINATDGTYHVAGGGIKEHRDAPLAPSYFSGTGQVTISGPGGTVVGRATFQDLLDFPPREFDLLFTTITACQLR